MSTSVSKTDLLIHVESGEYPLVIASLKGRHPNVSFGAEVELSFLKSLGYEVVQKTPRPEADVVSEVAPALQDGVYVQTFEARAFNEQEVALQVADKKRTAEEQLRKARESELDKGAPVQFAGREGILHVQMRDGDRANTLGLRARAEVLKEQGVVDTVIPFRTYENVVVMLTPAQFIDLAWAVFDSYSALMASSWEKEEQIAAATSIAQVEAVDLEFAQQTVVID